MAALPTTASFPPCWPGCWYRAITGRSWEMFTLKPRLQGCQRCLWSKHNNINRRLPVEKTHCQLKGQPLQDEQHLRWLHRDRGTKVPKYSWTEDFQFSYPSIIWTYWAQVGDNRTSRSSKAFVASQTTESRGNASVEDRFKDDLWVDSIIESKARHSFPSGFAHCTVEDSVLDQAFLLCDVIIAMILIIFWTKMTFLSKDSAANVIKAV